MVKRMVKFPLKMKNGTEVRTLEELRDNADIESIMNYYFSGQLSRWCKAFNINGLPEKILEADVSLVEEVLDILGIGAYEEEILDYIENHFRKGPETVPETELTEEDEVIDNKDIKSKIKTYLSTDINLDKYEIELIPNGNGKGSIYEYCVKVSNITTDQYYRFIIPYDSASTYIKERFEADLYRRIAKSVTFLKENDDYNKKYVLLNVGDTFKFGRFNGKEIEWKVLSKTDNSMYVISTEILCKRMFRADWRAEDANIWEKSNIRRWLNEDFYSVAFTENEKEKIGTVESDRVTLLSKKEAESLMTEQERASGSWWWLRSAYPHVSTRVWRVYSDGTLRSYYVSLEGGVRPALNLKF